VAYLYTVGSGGDYATISAALSAVETDWGGNTFDADVTVRILDSASYNEKIDLSSVTWTSTWADPLIIEAASGQTPTIDRTSLAAHIVNGNNKYLIIDGLTFSGANSGGADLYNVRGWVRNCTFQTGVTYFYGYWLNVYGVIEDCTVNNSNHNRGFWRNVYGWVRRCKFDWHSQAMNGLCYGGSGHVIVEACQFIGNGTGGEIDYGTGAGYSLVVFKNCSFLNIDGLSGASTSPPWVSELHVLNCIFRNCSSVAVGKAGYRNLQMVVEACCFSTSNGYVIDEDGTYSTLTDLRNAGYDTLKKCITDDPKYVSETSGSEDLNLQSDSPCINAGVGAGVLKDINGNTAPDPYHPAIGADFQHDVDTSTPPSAPTLSCADAGDGTNITATVDGDDGVTNYVKYRALGSSTWTAGGSRSGDGTISVATGPGSWELYAYSESAGGAGSPPSEICCQEVARAAGTWTEDSGAATGGWTEDT